MTSAGCGVGTGAPVWAWQGLLAKWTLLEVSGEFQFCDIGISN